ncbi:MAG: hotdog domain-containing protein [Frankia sp.]
MAIVTSDEDRNSHIITELGFAVSKDESGLNGTASVVPEMFVPGTTVIRTSVLATWTDVASGLLAVDVFAPRVPVTLDLNVQLYAPPRDVETINATARVIKAGRSVVVVTVALTGDDGRELGLGGGSFMAAPDPTVTMPHQSTGERIAPPVGRLRVPFAERARCEVREPGVATLPRSGDGLNASNTINGGLIALTVEEAALSLTPGASLSSLSMRYLRPMRIGPAIATAQVTGNVGRVEVRDAGADDRLAVFAVTTSTEDSKG